MSNFRHTVTFKIDNTTDEDVDPNYQSFLESVPCNIKPVGGGEIVRGKQLQAETNHVIETRYYAGLLPNMIAVNEQTDAEYSITRIINVDERNRYLMMEAIEVVI